MTDSLSRRLTVLAVTLMAVALLVTAALAAQAQDADDDPSDAPTADSDLDASEDPDDEATDEATDEPSDEPSDDASEALGSDAPGGTAGLEALLTDDAVDSDALYQAFVQFLISEYDSTIVVEDDTLSIQFDLQDL